MKTEDCNDFEIEEEQVAPIDYSKHLSKPEQTHKQDSSTTSTAGQWKSLVSGLGAQGREALNGGYSIEAKEDSGQMDNQPKTLRMMEISFNQILDTLLPITDPEIL